MHVGTLVRHDVAEVGHVAGCQVGAQLLERLLLRELGRGLHVGIVHDAVVLGDVLRVAVRDAVALRRVAVPTEARVGHVLEVALPAQPGLLHLRHEVGS